MAETNHRPFRFETEIDFLAGEVRLTFLGKTNTFVFDDEKFPLVEALKVLAEFAHDQLRDLLKAACEHIEKRDIADTQEKIRWMSKLQRGDILTWTDPDGGTCSRIAQPIHSIYIDSDGTAKIAWLDGGELVCPVSELS